jgi:membrane fusion protein (multidrug efflux system)
MTKTGKWIVTGIILLFIIGMIAYPRIKKQFQVNDDPHPVVTSGQAKRVLNINVIVMKPQVLSDKTNTTADIIPDEEVDLSFETSGKIVEIDFQEGTHVHKGDLLAKINDKPLQAQLHKLEAQIPLAKDRVYRQRTLLDKDAVSQEAYEQVATEYDKLMADIELMKANINQTELRAPFDGIIGLRYVSEGAYTSPTTTIAKLTKISPVKIDFPIPERYSDDIVPGTKVIFRVTGSLKEYHSEVYAVESKVDMETRSLIARAVYPNADESIKPGRYASVELTKKELRNALAVPSEALIQEMGKSLVYLYKSGKAQPAEIITGLRTESQIQVITGLNAGDTVIVSGVMQLRTDLPVTIDNIL